MSQRVRFRTAAQFSKFIKKHVAMTKRREALFFQRIVRHAEKSLRFGSPTTGSPGQPFATGQLRDKSFFKVGTIKEREVTMGFDVKIARHAPFIEAGLFNQVSPVGGPHSVKITTLNFNNIMRLELALTKAEISRVK